MSDEQDFFFDEEAEAPAKETKTQTKSAEPAKAAGGSTGGGFFGQDVTMAVASLMAVVALLVGVIVGILLPRPGTAGSAGAGAPITTPSGSVGNAGPLPPGTDTDKLPDGHPDISGMTGSSGASGTAESTSSK